LSSSLPLAEPAVVPGVAVAAPVDAAERLVAVDAAVPVDAAELAVPVDAAELAVALWEALAVASRSPAA
jgi:hypothetical protein